MQQLGSFASRVLNRAAAFHRAAGAKQQRSGAAGQLGGSRHLKGTDGNSTLPQNLSCRLKLTKVRQAIINNLVPADYSRSHLRICGQGWLAEVKVVTDTIVTYDSSPLYRAQRYAGRQAQVACLNRSIHIKHHL